MAQSAVVAQRPLFCRPCERLQAAADRQGLTQAVAQLEVSPAHDLRLFGDEAGRPELRPASRQLPGTYRV